LNTLIKLKKLNLCLPVKNQENQVVEKLVVQKVKEAKKTD